jgi:hypothetical protein
MTTITLKEIIENGFSHNDDPLVFECRHALTETRIGWKHLDNDGTYLIAHMLRMIRERDATIHDLTHAITVKNDELAGIQANTCPD